MPQRRDKNALFDAGLSGYVCDKCPLCRPADVGGVFANRIIGGIAQAQTL